VGKAIDFDCDGATLLHMVNVRWWELVGESATTGDVAYASLD